MDSERDVNLSVGVRALLRAGLAGLQGGATPDGRLGELPRWTRGGRGADAMPQRRTGLVVRRVKLMLGRSTGALPLKVTHCPPARSNRSLGPLGEPLGDVG